MSYTLRDNESFEFGFGDWSLDFDSDYHWQRNSGSTPSSDTGPTAAWDGSYYIYVETSDVGGNEESIIEFDLPLPLSGYLDFYYHQYGTDQGTLYLEGYDGSSWNEIWSSSGDQGDQWNNATTPSTDFSNYSKLRFRNVHDSGGSFRGDISLDDISIYTNEGLDLSGSVSVAGNSAENALVIAYNKTRDIQFDPVFTDSSGNYSISEAGLAGDIISVSVQYEENGELFGDLKTIQLQS